MDEGKCIHASLFLWANLFPIESLPDNNTCSAIEHSSSGGFDKQNESQENGDQNQRTSSLGRSNYLPETIGTHFNRVSIKTDKYKNNIPNTKDCVNNSQASSFLNTETIPGEAKIKPNQTAEIFRKTSAIEENQAARSFLEKENSIELNLSESKNSVKDAKWTKVIYLKEGMEIAVAPSKLDYRS